MFYLTTHSTHFIYDYMASDIKTEKRIVCKREVDEWGTRTVNCDVIQHSLCDFVTVCVRMSSPSRESLCLVFFFFFSHRYEVREN